MIYVQIHYADSLQRFDAKAKQLKEIAMAKEKHSLEIQAKLEALGEQEQAKHIAALLDEEVSIFSFLNVFFLFARFPSFFRADALRTS